MLRVWTFTDAVCSSPHLARLPCRPRNLSSEVLPSVLETLPSLHNIRGTSFIAPSRDSLLARSRLAAMHRASQAVQYRVTPGGAVLRHGAWDSTLVTKWLDSTPLAPYRHFESENLCSSMLYEAPFTTRSGHRDSSQPRCPTPPSYLTPPAQTQPPFQLHLPRIDQHALEFPSLQGGII